MSTGYAAPLHGSRIRSIPDPAQPETRRRVCGRCGIDWEDKRYRFLTSAPCRDCRDALVADGHTRNEFLRPQHRTPEKDTPAP